VAVAEKASTEDNSVASRRNTEGGRSRGPERLVSWRRASVMSFKGRLLHDNTYTCSSQAGSVVCVLLTMGIKYNIDPRDDGLLSVLAETVLSIG
jgi:hypothetical protein